MTTRIDPGLLDGSEQIERIQEHRDEIAVLQILHGSAPGQPTCAQPKELAGIFYDRRG